MRLAETLGVSEIAPGELLLCLVRSSLFRVAAIYGERSDGSIEYRGERPDTQWEGHGYFSRTLWMLNDGQPIKVTVWKRRWRLKGTNKTCHSRPPDDLSVRSCSLIVVLSLWSWLSSDKGLHNHQPVLVGLDLCYSNRTQQRWMNRALTRALEAQQATRRAVQERCEPRPVETLFEGGLSPPKGLTHRQWKDPTAATYLWRAFAILFSGALELDVNVALLLAEARRRWETEDSPFPI